MKIKLIALDLDGTLINSEKQITPSTLSTIEKLQIDGVRIVLASGRPLHGMIPIMQKLKLKEHSGFVITNNGSEIYECETGGRISAHFIDATLLPEIKSFANDSELTLFCYHENRVVTEETDSEYVAKACMINNMIPRKVYDFAKDVDFALPKCIIAGKTEKLVEVEKKMKTFFGKKLGIYRSSPVFLEIVPPNIDKGGALTELAAKLSIEMSSTMAFGDAPNDKSMIMTAGIGVAMGNAEEDVKAVADFVTRTNDEDGVAYALQRYF